MPFLVYRELVERCLIFEFGGTYIRNFENLQSSETFYDQKPEESVVISATSPASAKSARSSFSSRFDYSDSVQTREDYMSPQVVSHVAPPKSAGFFEEYEINGGDFQKKPITSSSKVQVSSFNFTLISFGLKKDLTRFFCTHPL